jgi:CO dehydrogenase maturation factor
LNELNKLGLQADGVIPLDEQISQYDLQTKPLLELPDDSEAVKAVDNLMTKILKNKIK